MASRVVKLGPQQGFHFQQQFYSGSISGSPEFSHMPTPPTAIITNGQTLAIKEMIHIICRVLGSITLSVLKGPVVKQAHKQKGCRPFFMLYYFLNFFSSQASKM